MTQPIPFPNRAAGKAPYFAWLAVRFPDGVLDYHPPLSEFLGTPTMGNAWTSYVPEGRRPTDIRVDVYLRRDWRGLPGLCIGNVVVDGRQAPRTWDETVERLIAEAVADVEARVESEGLGTLCVTGCGPELRQLFLARGYVPRDVDPDELIRPTAA